MVSGANHSSDSKSIQPQWGRASILTSIATNVLPRWDLTPMSGANPYKTQEIQREKSERERGPIHGKRREPIFGFKIDWTPMGSIPMSEANPYNTQEIQREKSEQERGPIMVSGANHTPDSARLLYTATPAPST